jgi:hypothetical protein
VLRIKSLTIMFIQSKLSNSGLKSVYYLMIILVKEYESLLGFIVEGIGKIVTSCSNHLIPLFRFKKIYSFNLHYCWLSFVVYFLFVHFLVSCFVASCFKLPCSYFRFICRYSTFLPNTHRRR